MFDLVQLKESKDFLQTVIENITSALFIVDKDIRVQSFNDSFKALFYRQEDQVIGKLCGNAIGCVYAVTENRNCGTTSNCEKCNLRSSLLRAFTEKVPTHREKIVRDFEINGKLINKYFLYSTKCVDYRNEEMILIMVDDITEIEEQKIRLEELNQLKNRFLGIAAHDLINPLNLIEGFSGELLEEAKESLSEDLYEYLSIIHRSSNNMLNLVNGLLDISAIESGQLDVQLTPGSLEQLIEERVKIYQTMARRKNISLNLSLSKIPKALFDEVRINQVFDNLVSNAIKFSPFDSEISISLKEEDGAAKVSVKDEGPGISNEDFPKLFVEFQKLSAQPTGDESSTGLGLSIVKKIVDAHGGKIWAESERSRGACFIFTLPLAG